MECEYCNLWYHTACEKIKQSDYEMLVRLKAINQLHWYCKNCIPKCTEVIKLVAEMNERQKTLTKKVDMCTQKLERMATYEDEQFKEKTKQLIQQETKDTVSQSHNGEQFKEQTRRLIREESYELKQREARECNIIISNISGEEEASDEEDGSSDTDTVVQRATDHEKVTEMIHKILKLENVEIMEVKRLSKPDDDERPRLVWVKFGSRIQSRPDTKEPGYEIQNQTKE